MGAWGWALFQSDTDLDAVADLDHSADLGKVKQKIMANPALYSFRKQSTGPNKQLEKDVDMGKDIYLSLYQPSHPDLIQEHLNNGVLLRLVDDLRRKNNGHHICILVACTMQLGCNIPDWLREELGMYYMNCRLPPEGKVHFAKALRDYRNGVPYPFHAKTVLETANTGTPRYNESEVIWMDLEDVPAGEEITQQKIVIERLYGDFNRPVDVCGSCGAGKCQDGSKLKRCSGCKERLYCSKACQKAHTPRHSCLCEGFKKLHEEHPADVCGNCGSKTGRDGAGLKRCGRCKERLYCSADCQAAHYPRHVRKCKAAVEAEKNRSSRSSIMLNVPQTW